MNGKYSISSNFFYFILLLLSVFEGSSQITLHSIHFEGQKKTKEFILKRQLLSSLGDSITMKSIMEDLQRVKNFPGIQNASFRLDTSATKGLALLFTVEEQRTLLPIVNFGGVKGNIWYQLGFSDSNLLGLGNFFSAQYQNSDGRHSGEVYFRSPKNVKAHWGYALSLKRWASVEPLFFPNATVNYNFDYNSVSLTGIYNIGYRRQFEFGGTYFVENYNKVSELDKSLPGPESLRQPKLLGKVSYYQNNLNYHFFTIDGYDFSSTYQEVYNTSDQSFFHIFMMTTRYFKSLEKGWNIASRLNFGISTNNNTPFAPFVVDSRVNLRGSGNRIDRGTAQLVWNAELRITHFHKKNWAAQWVGFSDLGTWRNPGGQLLDFFDSNQFRHFVGLGYRLIYKKIYGAVLRIDYGIDVYNTNERGIVFGFGQFY